MGGPGLQGRFGVDVDVVGGAFPGYHDPGIPGAQGRAQGNRGDG